MSPAEISSRDAALRLLADIPAITKVLPIRCEHRGDSAEVVYAEYAGDPVVIKFGYGCDCMAAERWALERLGSHGIPVPRTYRLEDPQIDQHFLVQGVAKGEQMVCLSAFESKLPLYLAAGDILRRIHEIALPGFGPLAVIDGQLAGQSQFWAMHMNHFRPDTPYLLETKLVDRTQVEVIHAAFRYLVSLSPARALLLHGDFTEEHIYFSGKEITGIIDFGSAFAGDPRHDIAIALFSLQPEERDSFIRGYGSLACDPAISLYSVLIAVGKLKQRHGLGQHSRLAKCQGVLRSSIIEAVRFLG